MPNANAAPEGAGDTWTWTARCADTTLALSWLVGGCDAEYANEFMQDLADRLANRVLLTSDGHRSYSEAACAPIAERWSNVEPPPNAAL